MRTIYTRKSAALFYVRRNGDPRYFSSPSPPKTLHPALETVFSYNLDFPDVTPAYWLLEVVCADQFETLTYPGKPRAFDDPLLEV